MHIKELAGKNICILGYGKEGKAMLEALLKYAPTCEVTIADSNPSITSDSNDHRVQVGDKWLEDLARFDVVIKSPGIQPSLLLTTHYKLLTTPTQIFFDSIRDSGATVVGITGSKGKSTTASLIYHILSRRRDLKTSDGGHNQPRSSGSQTADCDFRIAATEKNVNIVTTDNVFLIGNIGEPAIAHIEDATKNTVFVFEMSSYQLMDLTVSPNIAIVTSFFPEHLDYHKSLEAYLEAKKHIARFQKKTDHIYYNAIYSECKEIAEESPGFKHPFSDIDAPVLIEQTKLQGTHNLSNIAAAFLVCEQLNAPQDIAIDAIKSFTPLPHRLQSLGVIDGIEWVNDSISTTPESAIAALDALGERVETIILGGQDRGYDFSPLVDRLKASSVKTVILLPDSGKKIGEMIRKAGLKMQCFDVKDMKEAVTKVVSHKSQVTSRKHAIPIVLLSPAAPSYGHFKNFEERGNQFSAAIKEKL